MCLNQDSQSSGGDDEDEKSESSSDNEPQFESNGNQAFSKKWILNMLKEHGNLYFPYPEHNETLWLNHRGFNSIRNMHLFPELKCLHYQCNGTRTMVGLESCVKLKTLILCDNAITSMEGLHTLVNLANLNLSNNFIGKIEGLWNCKKLEMLNLSRNNLGRQEVKSVDSVKGLLRCPSIHTLDLSSNYLDDASVLSDVFSRMDELCVLDCKDNRFQDQFDSFRKRMIAGIENLCHLNGMQVYEHERRCVMAWVKDKMEGWMIER